ncbi:hypothetical protein PYW08_013178 [Mythimna loreyi]|uniref:Uncharacterized protein n=1 Tax=Mythimna loreyi TaxID=667449 RepID=A0ACC2QHJ4_9NEOP|nr:hypothetical protein PYW08_013178 [Mythimna loreyi]
MQTLTVVKLILLFYMLPFVENLSRTRRLENGSIFYEPVSAVDIAFDEFPTLTDVLPNLVKKKTASDYDKMSAMALKNISIDMDRININKFRKKMDTIADMIGKDEPELNVSRRQAYINWGQGSGHFYASADQMVRRKALDLMLQVLYMARHKIGKIERAKHFSTKDTSFRVAYAYRTITRIFRKMMRLYSYQARNREYDTAMVQLILHGRVSRLHVDLCYLYWVLIKIDGIYKKAKGVRKEKKRMQKMLEEQIQAQKDAQSAIKGGVDRPGKMP